MKECNIVKQSPIAGLAAYGGGAGSVIFGRKGVDGYQIDRSLRFNSADSAYLNRTPSSAGSNTTWTLSTWVKKTGNDNHIFGAGAGNNPGRFGFGFNGSDKIFAFVIASNSTVFSITTDAVFRDPSAWYHIVLIADTTNSTQADRFKIYVNGVLQTVTGTLMPSSQNTYVNTTAAHTFGRRSYTSSDYFNGYLADVNFIDGQAHAVTDFGAYDADTGIWNPKRFSGSFGTNGFHLKFADYSSNAALGTDSSSNSNTWTVNNFSVNDGSAVTVSTATGAAPIRNTTGDQGGTAASGFRTDANASSLFLALPLNTNTSDVSYSINSSSTTKTTTNQSTATSSSQSRFYGNSSYWNSKNDGILVAESGSELVVGTGDFTIELWFRDDSNHGGGGSGRCYLFDNRIGGSVVGDPPQLTGYVDGSNTIKFGCASTISVSKSTDNKWIHFAAVRSSGTCTLYIDGVSVGTASDTTNYPNNGFGIGRATDGGYGWAGYIQDFRVYKTAKYTSDFSIPAEANPTVGAGNDSLIDTPTNYTADSGNNGGNYCTLNPLDRQSTNGTLSNGNLDLTQSSAAWAFYRGTIGVSSGKYYWELTIGNNQYTTPAIVSSDYSMGENSNVWVNGDADIWGYYPYEGKKYNNDSGASYATADTSASGSVIGVALDMDNGTLTFYKDGSSLGQAFSGLTGKTMFPGAFLYNQSNADSYNFGQRPFAHTPPTGYVSLCTQNLPDPTIADGSSVFDIVLWTGNGSSPRDISGYSFSPDLVWYKQRDQHRDHQLYDTVRGSGTNKSLASNTMYAETANDDELYGYLSAFNSDGFEVTTGSTNDNYNNNNGSTYVGWAWDAGSSLSTVINVGDKNSSAYNTSDTWSGDLSSPNGAYNNSPVTNAFNGSLTSGFEAGNPSSGYSTIRFQPATAITVNTQIRIYVFDYNDGSVTYQYRVNDGSWNNMPGESSSPYRAWRDLGFTGSLSSFEYRSNTSITYKPTLFAVEIDGALLIDNGTDLSGFTQYPSISSTVRANTSAGFSIVNWSGTSANATVAHGLNAAPEFIITKVRGMTSNWYCYHTGLTDATKYIWLNSTAAQGTQTAAWNSTDPTSSVIHVGGEAEVNRNGYNTIAYCFAPVEGYSSFGSYAGTGQADGPFIYTGFRPRLIMIKDITSTGWFHVHDSVRDPENVSGARLFWGDSYSEQPNDSAYGFDLLSNGFKVRNSHSESNDSGQTYIYAAWAENPFKTARAR